MAGLPKTILCHELIYLYTNVKDFSLNFINPLICKYGILVENSCLTHSVQVNMKYLRSTQTECNGLMWTFFTQARIWLTNADYRLHSTVDILAANQAFSQRKFLMACLSENACVTHNVMEKGAVVWGKKKVVKHVNLLLLTCPNIQTNNQGKSRGTLGNLWWPPHLSSGTHAHNHMPSYSLTPPEEWSLFWRLLTIYN